MFYQNGFSRHHDLNFNVVQTNKVKCSLNCGLCLNFQFKFIFILHFSSLWIIRMEQNNAIKRTANSCTVMYHSQDPYSLKIKLFHLLKFLSLLLHISMLQGKQNI